MSHIYTETTESNELYLYADNTYSIYKGSILPAVENLKRKYQHGEYNHEKAVTLWFYVACEAAKRYVSEFCTAGVHWYDVFDTTSRYTVAVDLERRYFEMVES